MLRPALQMAVDDDVIIKNPFGFELATVLVNDSVTREAITKDQMRKFLRFVHDDLLYCKYYEVVYILFHTGMRISEFCGLTLKDIDLKNNTVNIDHQLLRTSAMEYIIQDTKTTAGTRVLPISQEVADMFRSIIDDRSKYKVEKVVQGYSGFLFLDKNGMPLVAMHWQHRFNHMVARYNGHLPGADAKHYASCVQAHLLFQHGKIRNESQDTAVPHGAFGYIGHHECVHAYRIR